MSMTPNQQRQKSIAEADALRHLRYSQADRERTHDAHTEPLNSPKIHAELMRVERATHKEMADIGDLE